MQAAGTGSSSAADDGESGGRLQSVMCCGKCMLGCLLQCACQCAWFWMPLTAVVISLWLIYRPDLFRPRVDSAVLAAFALDAPPSTGTHLLLRYDLAVDLSFRNSHGRLAIEYLDVGAAAFYNGTKLGDDEAMPAAPFQQGPKSKDTTVLRPAFRGVVPVDAGVAAELERELAAGTVHVRVTVALTLMYKVWLVDQVFFYKYDCWLWFPPPADDAPAIFDAGTQCWPA
nr:unnamed protein product [Digitaria exilis]